MGWFSFEKIRPKKRETVLGAVLRSSFLNTAAKVFGYLRNVVIAYFLGFTAETDAYFMAVSLSSLFLTFADVFDSVGVPNLVEAGKKSREEFEEIASFMLLFTTLLVAVVVILYFPLSPLIFKIPVGFSPRKLHIMKICYGILFFHVVFYFYYHHFGAVLRSMRFFTPFYVAEFLASFIFFLATALGLFVYRSVLVLPIAYSMARLFPCLYLAYSTNIHSPIRISLIWNEKTRFIVKQFFQLCILYGVGYLYQVVDRAFASILPTKSISALAYGSIIAFLPRGIMKFENILITPLSEVKAEIKKLKMYLGKILALSILAAVFMFFSASLIIKIFFMHGAFSHVDWRLATEATKYYALCLPASFLWPIFYRAYQIRNKLNVLIPLSLASVTMNGLLNYVFLVKLGMGIKGICLGTFISGIFLCTFSYMYFLVISKD